MRMVKKVISEKEEVYKIICNMCGESIRQDEYGVFFDHLSVTKEWGYLSSNDGEVHKFDICDKCYADFINKFKINIFNTNDIK